MRVKINVKRGGLTQIVTRLIMGVTFDPIRRLEVFEFTDLDGLSRLLLLKKQKESIDYWRQLTRLKGAFVLWEDKTYSLIRDYKASGGASDLTKALDAVAIKGEITLRKLENQISRLNDYLKDIDVRLADGTKWYNAIEIKEMFESIEESRSPDAY